MNIIIAFNMSKKDPVITTYNFPIVDKGALTFTASKVFVHKAILRINDRIMSVIYPTYDYKYRAADYESDEKMITGNNCNEEMAAPDVDLDFLGNVPLQCGLLTECNVQVILYCLGRSYPSLTFETVDSLTWDKFYQDEYTEVVVAGSDNGPKKLLLVYMRNDCGYRNI